MSPNSDDLAIEAVVRKELDEGLLVLARAGFVGGKVSAYRQTRTDIILIQIGGRFGACPDRDVYATVEVDPGRVGWRLDGDLWEYPDGDDHDSQIASLGGARIHDATAATDTARTLATAAWVAVLEYLRNSCHERNGP